MNRVEAALRRIASELDSRQAKWALVGGFAVSARAEPRFTRDVDVAVLVENDDAAEQLIHSLTADGYRLSALVEQDAVGRLATVRLISPDADGVGVVVDLIFATAGIEPEIVTDADVLEILPAVSMPVATAGHLVALKLRDDETRPQDAADLRANRDHRRTGLRPGDAAASAAVAWLGG
ncbi:MAG: nucleotidyl transferase AbiEii/AbiGii toxin family protein [Pseudonocardiales bacterium]